MEEFAGLRDVSPRCETESTRHDDLCGCLGRGPLRDSVEAGLLGRRELSRTLCDVEWNRVRRPSELVPHVAASLEKIYGWMKAVAGFRRSRFRGRRKTAFAGTITAATYNLLRITKLQPAT